MQLNPQVGFDQDSICHKELMSLVSVQHTTLEKGGTRKKKKGRTFGTTTLILPIEFGSNGQQLVTECYTNNSTLLFLFTLFSNENIVSLTKNPKIVFHAS